MMKKFCGIPVMLSALLAVGCLCGCQTHQSGEGIVLNEICGKDKDGLEWIEVGNASHNPINLKGYKLWKMDAEGIDKKLYTFPDTTLGPNQILIVNEESLKAHIPHKKAVIVELYDANGELVDSFDSDEELDTDSLPAGSSYARIPNLTGEWQITEHATWNEANVE